MLRLLQIPAWRDNYIYLLAHDHEALVVDPTEAEPVLEVLKQEGLTLKTILNTHHHPDHVGGNQGLVENTGCEVVGPAHDADRIPGINRRARVHEVVTALGLDFRVLDVRAHTRGHICYALDRPLDEVVRRGHDGAAGAVPRLAGRPALFVGDSLFLGGCGRLFEGSPEQLAASMEVYRQESPEALVCCAHEYTTANLRFARHVLPDNQAVTQRLEGLDDERAGTGSSVPDILGLELQTNPFLLAFDEQWAAQMADRLGVPADDKTALEGALRSAKDSF